MPRTRCKKTDDRGPLEKLQKVESKLDLYIFFQYFDGYNSDGMVGFNVNTGPPGSAKHWAGGFFEAYLTKSQFRSKGLKLATLARFFVSEKITPPPEMRPYFTQQEINNAREEKRDKRTPLQKLGAVTDLKQLFIFFKYYDGYSTGGEIGFSPNAGPPGSINHKRAYASILEGMKDDQFRDKGKLLANLAMEFFDGGIVPPEYLRPRCPERETPRSMVEEAMRVGY